MRLDLGGSICAGDTLICCLEMVTWEKKSARSLIRFLRLFRWLKGLSFGELILALQVDTRIDLGVDNLNVVRHVARIISGGKSDKPVGCLY